MQSSLAFYGQQIAGKVDILCYKIGFQSMAVHFPAFLAALMVNRLIQPNQPLWIIDGRLFIKNHNILNAAHWLFFGVGKSCRTVFMPIPAVTEQFAIALDERRCEWLDCCKYDCTIILDDALILFPELIKWQYAVPSTVGDTIR